MCKLLFVLPALLFACDSPDDEALFTDLEFVEDAEDEPAGDLEARPGPAGTPHAWADRELARAAPEVGSVPEAGGGCGEHIGPEVCGPCILIHPDPAPTRDCTCGDG